MPVVAVDFAINDVLGSGETLSPGAVRRCCEMAGKFARFKPGEDVREATHDLSNSAYARLTEQQILTVIDADVRRIRMEVFGKESAPFESTEDGYRAAVTWIQNEDNRDKSLTPEALAEYKRLRDEIEERASRIAKILGHPARFKTTWPKVRYYQLDSEDVGYLQLRAHSPAYPLVRDVPRLAEETGFSESDLMAYVLCGLQPKLPRVRTSTTERFGRVSRTTTTIVVQDPEFDEKDLRPLFRELRNSWKQNKNDAALRNVVAGMDGSPDGAPLAYWVEVYRRWKDAGLPVRGKDTPEQGAARLRRRYSRTRTRRSGI